jgi:hypothetical protein
MIKCWNRFFESNTEKFTEEMAQEIIYYFSENSEVSKGLENLFFNHPENDQADHFVAYETGYDEYKQWINRLMGMVNTKSLTFKDDMIELYNKIREERKNFPLICEIEDELLQLIDRGYEFNFIHCSNTEYYIRIYKQIDSSSEVATNEFIKNMSFLSNSVIRKFSKTGLSVKLRESTITDNTYSYGDNLGKDFNTITYKIIMQKT